MGAAGLKIFCLFQFWHLNLSRTNWGWEVTILFHKKFWSSGRNRNISFNIFTKIVSKHLFSDLSYRGMSVRLRLARETHVFNLFSFKLEILIRSKYSEYTNIQELKPRHPISQASALTPNQPSDERCYWSYSKMLLENTNSFLVIFTGKWSHLAPAVNYRSKYKTERKQQLLNTRGKHYLTDLGPDQ